MTSFTWRHSPTDLATDIAHDLSRRETEELVEELRRFLVSEPAKFVKENTQITEAIRSLRTFAIQRFQAGHGVEWLEGGVRHVATPGFNDSWNITVYAKPTYDLLRSKEWVLTQLQTGYPIVTP